MLGTCGAADVSETIERVSPEKKPPVFGLRLRPVRCLTSCISLNKLACAVYHFQRCRLAHTRKPACECLFVTLTTVKCNEEKMECVRPVQVAEDDGGS
jgi:hypothetical protein